MGWAKSLSVSSSKTNSLFLSPLPVPVWTCLLDRGDQKSTDTSIHALHKISSKAPGGKKTQQVWTCIYVFMWASSQRSHTKPNCPGCPWWLTVAGQGQGPAQVEKLRWHLYTVKAYSWKASQATQLSSTEGLMSIGLKAYLFWVRVTVSTRHNSWPLSSLGLT